MIDECTLANRGRYYSARAWALWELSDFRSATIAFVRAAITWREARVLSLELESEALGSLSSILEGGEVGEQQAVLDAVASLAEMACLIPVRDTLTERAQYHYRLDRGVDAALWVALTRISDLYNDGIGAIPSTESQAPPADSLPDGSTPSATSLRPSPPTAEELLNVYQYLIIELQELVRSQFIPAREIAESDLTATTALSREDGSETNGRFSVLPASAPQPVSIFPESVGVMSMVANGFRLGPLGSQLSRPTPPSDMMADPIALLSVVDRTVGDRPWVLWVACRIDDSVIHTLLTADGPHGMHGTRTGEGLVAFQRVAGRSLGGRSRGLWSVIPKEHYTPELVAKVAMLRREAGCLGGFTEDDLRPRVSCSIQDLELPADLVDPVVEWILELAAEDPAEADLALACGQELIPDGLEALLEQLGPDVHLVIAPSDDLAGFPFGWLAAPRTPGNPRLLELATVRQIPAASLLALMDTRPRNDDYPARVIAVRDPEDELKNAWKRPDYTIHTIELVGEDTTCAAVRAALRDVQPGQPGAFIHHGHHTPLDAFGSGRSPGLVLADGVLMIAELFGVGISPADRIAVPRLGMLFGCESRGANAAEQLNTASGLLHAGARDVICALWPILDLDYTDLEQAVVEAALAGNDPAETLTKWQRDVLTAWRNNSSTDPRHAPLTWAAFTTLSGPTPPT